MHISTRIAAFSRLGTWLNSEDGKEAREEWASIAASRNGWFVPENVEASLSAIADGFLQQEQLEQWVASYPELHPETPQKVGLVLAGNIPAVGFHDILSVLIAGHIAAIKPSSQDEVLIRALLGKLVELEPGFAPFIVFQERMNDADAIIATGSDNSARYFEYYFAKKPHVIRKNRTSVAILDGNETPEEILALGKDITMYYGLGCRNVSKIYVPNTYDFTTFFEAIASLETITHNHKYVHNYDYNKSIFLVNRTPFLDNGFLLLTESEALVSPISVLFYERYADRQALEAGLSHDKIQCIAGKGFVPFGETQSPKLWDYADGVDTMQFLVNLG